MFGKVKKVTAATLALATVATMAPIDMAKIDTAYAVATNFDVATSYKAFREPTYVDANCDGKNEIVWSTFEMGEYPQAEVKDEELINQLNSLENSEWTKITNPYTKYRKKEEKAGVVTYNGNKYLRMCCRDASVYSSEAGYYKWADKTSYHYFLYQPIKWRVLSVNEDGSNCLVVADIALNAQPFNYSLSTKTVNKKTAVPSDWRYSTLRSFLNAYDGSTNGQKADYSSYGFYNMAFSEAEKENILTTKNANDKGKYSSTKVGSSTEKIFCLTYKDALNADYGFGGDAKALVNARINACSDYAKAMGAFGADERVYWVTRSGGKSNTYVSNVDYMGDLHTGGNTVDCPWYGVRPAMNVNLAAIYEADKNVYTGYVDENRQTHKYRVRFIENGTNNTYIVSDTNGVINIPYGYEKEGYNYSYAYKVGESYYRIDFSKTVSVSSNLNIYVTKTVKATATPEVTATPVVTQEPTSTPEASTTPASATPTADVTSTPEATQVPDAKTITLYYKRAENTSWKTAYVHYKVDGTWTKAPGQKMTQVDKGYWTYTIALGTAKSATLCFTNGSGTWDNNGGKNYTISEGSYLVDQKKGTVTKK